MSLSEVLVFYQALHSPRVLTAQQLADLNLTSIPEGAQETLEGITPHQKRAHKMFYKVWNALGKHMHTVLMQQRRPIEVPGFAIFAPTTIETASTNKLHHQVSSEINFMLSNWGVAARGKQPIQVKLILHSEFLTRCGDNVHIPA
jgi:hypothetical protein